MRRVDHQHVDARPHQRLGPHLPVGPRTDRRPDPQAAEVVLRRMRKADRLLDVLDGDEAAELVLLVDHRELLDAVAVEDLLGLVERDAGARRHQPLACHHLADGAVEPLLEAQVPVREDADQPSALCDRQPGDARALHDCKGLGDRLLGLHGHRIDDHPALGLLHLLDLERLVGEPEVPVDDPDTAFLRHGDRRARLGDGVHRGGEERDVEADGARQLGRDVGVARQDLGSGGNQEHVVEGEPLTQLICQHGPSSGYTKGPTRRAG